MLGFFFASVSVQEQEANKELVLLVEVPTNLDHRFVRPYNLVQENAWLMHMETDKRKLTSQCQDYVHD